MPEIVKYLFLRLTQIHGKSACVAGYSKMTAEGTEDAAGTEDAEGTEEWILLVCFHGTVGMIDGGFLVRTGMK